MQKPHWTRKRRMACVAGGGRVRSGGRGGQAVQGSGLWLKRPGRACDVKVLSVGGGLWGACGRRVVEGSSVLSAQFTVSPKLL